MEVHYDQIPDEATEDNRGKRKYVRFVFAFWVLWAVMILTPAALFIGAYLGAFGDMPSFVEIANPKNSFSSEVISEDKKLLGTFYVQNRMQIEYKDISKHVVDALIATEDSRFFFHSGIDFWRSFTILFYNLSGNKQGASTISQQLALNLFSYRERNPIKRAIQKVKEWIIAVQIERNFTKQEIITLYLNTVDFGYNSFGISSAAKTFFNVLPKDLTIGQSAMLVGLLKGTTYYSPIKNMQRATQRRNVVLHRMLDEGYLTEEQYQKSSQESITLDLNRDTHVTGLAPYFRSVVGTEVRKMIKNLDLRKDNGELYDIYRDGLRIYTTVNSVLQKYAEEAQREYLPDLQKQYERDWGHENKYLGIDTLLETLIKRTPAYKEMHKDGLEYKEILKRFKKKKEMQVFSWTGTKDTVMSSLDSLKYYKSIIRNSILALDPRNGEIRVWVGGIDFETFKYDQVRVGTRQVGSTAKPFTYAVAIENGFEPCMTVENETVTIGDWTPRSSHPIPGQMTLKNALALSQNYITAYLIKQVGAERVAEFTKNCGITSEVPPYPSICLGSFEASVFDLVGAYTPFVNDGVWIEPNFISRVEDRFGKVLYRHVPKKRTVLEANSAFIILDMLKQVVKLGTGIRLRYRYGLNGDIAGKTGTTQKNSDAWFMGITPHLITGVWTGFEDRTVHFNSIAIGQGANAALPIFAIFWKKVLADESLPYSKDDLFEESGKSVLVETECPPDAYDVYLEKRRRAREKKSEDPLEVPESVEN